MKTLSVEIERGQSLRFFVQVPDEPAPPHPDQLALPALETLA